LFEREKKKRGSRARYKWRLNIKLKKD